MMKAMLAVGLFALLPASALAAPDQSARPAAHKSQPAQIATLGGDFPTSLSDEELLADNSDDSQANYSQGRSEQNRTAASSEHQPEPLPNGQPKYVTIYWFIGH